jgi:hypothetical protein
MTAASGVPLGLLVLPGRINRSGRLSVQHERGLGAAMAGGQKFR